MVATQIFGKISPRFLVMMIQFQEHCFLYGLVQPPTRDENQPRYMEHLVSDFLSAMHFSYVSSFKVSGFKLRGASCQAFVATRHTGQRTINVASCQA